MYFRIEKNGIGPYRYHSFFPGEGMSLDLWMDNQHTKHQMPTPSQDSVLCKIYSFIEQVSKKFPKQILFAFNNPNDIETYFSEDELKKLKKLGFTINSYSEDSCFKVLHGESQVVLFLSEESYNSYLELISESSKSGFIPYF